MSGSGTLCASIDTHKDKYVLCVLDAMSRSGLQRGVSGRQGLIRIARRGDSGMRNRAVSLSWRSCGPSETRGAGAPEEIRSKYGRMGTSEMMRSLARKRPKGAELVVDSLLMLQALAKTWVDELEALVVELVQDNAPALLKI
ncbi:MAG: hypothetical protein ACFNZW_07215 [Coriobacteriaceae bacterium]